MMEFGGYNFSALQAIQGIAYRSLKKYTPRQIVQSGLKVERLVTDYRAAHPEKVPQRSGVGLLDWVVPVDDFSLALHLVNTRNPGMAKLDRKSVV